MLVVAVLCHPIAQTFCSERLITVCREFIKRASARLWTSPCQVADIPVLLIPNTGNADEHSSSGWLLLKETSVRFLPSARVPRSGRRPPLSLHPGERISFSPAPFLAVTEAPPSRPAGTAAALTTASLHRLGQPNSSAKISTARGNLRGEPARPGSCQARPFRAPEASSLPSFSRLVYPTTRSEAKEVVIAIYR